MKLVCKSFLVPALMALLCTLQSCANAQGQPIISGKIKLSPEYSPILYVIKPAHYRQLISPYEGAVIDSVSIAPDGSFALTDKPGLYEKGLYLLEIQQNTGRYKNEIITRPDQENYICLVLESGHPIKFSAKASALNRTYQLENADAENQLIAQFRDARAPFFQEFDQIVAKTPKDSVLQWASHGSEKIRHQVNIVTDSLAATATTVYPIFVAWRLCAPENEFFDQPEKALRAYERIQALAPAHPWIPELGAYLERSKLPVLKGEKMPDFALPNPEGDTIRLESVQSELLLVDFWASWCAPCRSEIRNTIVPLYQSYHAKGFNVVGISIDQDRSAWMSAIKKDGAVWPQASDLMGDASPVRYSLRFRYIPCNYLLDASGKLLARDIHGDALRQFVEAYLTKK
ncbi:MAG: TlpA disulfide reductase family protein [Bacteroidota bacterium]